MRTVSQLTLHNHTPYAAEFVVSEGHQRIVRAPGVAPGAQASVSTTRNYRLAATARQDDRLYTVAPLEVSGAAGFRTQVLKVSEQGVRKFDKAHISRQHAVTE